MNIIQLIALIGLLTILYRSYQQNKLIETLPRWGFISINVASYLMIQKYFPAANFFVIYLVSSIFLRAILILVYNRMGIKLTW